MSFLDKIFKRNNKNAQSRPERARDYYPSSTVNFGKDGTSFACIDRIATEFAQLGYGVYDKKTRQKLTRNPIYSLLSQPNLEEDQFLFMYNCAIDYFNGGCYLLKAQYQGETVSLFRLNPSAIKKQRNKRNELEYCYNGSVYTSDKVLYIPSRFNYSTLNGGMSIFNAVHGTFETSSKLETFTKAAFDNGVTGKRLVVDISGRFPDATESQLTDLKSSMASEYAGIENAGRPLFKQKGIEYSELGSGTDNRAAELAENRAMQKQDVAMIFGVPLELLSAESSKVDTEKAFLMLCEFAVKPLAMQFQQAFNKLLNSDSQFFEFDYNNILKVSLAQRIDAYNKQINNGLLSPNEARRKENLPELEGNAGNNFFIPANLMPLNDDTINAYMAKQKIALQQAEASESSDTDTTEGVLNSQHSPNGDDKQ